MKHAAIVTIRSVVRSNVNYNVFDPLAKKQHITLCLCICPLARYLSLSVIIFTRWASRSHGTKNKTLQRKHCSFIRIEVKKKRKKMCAKCLHVPTHQDASRAGVTFIAADSQMLFTQNFVSNPKLTQWSVFTQNMHFNLPKGMAKVRNEIQNKCTVSGKEETNITFKEVNWNTNQAAP